MKQWLFGAMIVAAAVSGCGKATKDSGDGSATAAGDKWSLELGGSYLNPGGVGEWVWLRSHSGEEQWCTVKFLLVVANAAGEEETLTDAQGDRPLEPNVNMTAGTYFAKAAWGAGFSAKKLSADFTCGGERHVLDVTSW